MRPAMFRLIAYGFGVLLPWLAQAAQAEEVTERIYQVELYVFSRDDARYSMDEYWPLPEARFFREEAMPLAEAAHILPSFMPIDRPGLKSANVLTGLKARHEHRLLFHAAWQQKMLPEAQATPILIQGGELLQGGEAVGDQPYELEGMVTLYIARYLHLEADLVLQGLGYDAVNHEWQQQGYYPLKQSRRMRSGELHYLDHPVFGLAVIVHRV